MKLVEDTGARIVAREADVRDRDALSTALQAGLDEFGRLDIVIANAGIAPMRSGEAGWRDVVDVNLTGVHHTVDVAIPTMVEQGDGGAIVLTSSAAGLVGIGDGDAGSLGYTAAKHGVVGLMRVYANHLAPHRKDFIDGSNMYNAALLYKRFRQRRQVWKFGLDPDDVAAFVGEYEWRLVEQAGPDYYVQTYLEPAARDLAASDLEWTASARRASP